MLADDFRSKGLEFVSNKVLFCGECYVEMVVVTRRATTCLTCGKRGADVVYKCPSCTKTKKRFEQELERPFCYGC